MRLCHRCGLPVEGCVFIYPAICTLCEYRPRRI